MAEYEDSARARDEKLGFGNYIMKEIYQTVVALGGMVGGAWAGAAAAAKWMKDTPMASVEQWRELPLVGKIPGLKNPLGQRQLMVGGLGGMFAGTLVSGLILGYGHWKKEKQAQMQVDEITKDISRIELFKKTDPELKAENQRLWKMIEEREGKKAGGHAAAVGKSESWQEQAVAERAEAATAEAARG